jgi:hypothetical protein
MTDEYENDPFAFMEDAMILLKNPEPAKKNKADRRQQMRERRGTALILSMVRARLDRYNLIGAERMVKVFA